MFLTACAGSDPEPAANLLLTEVKSDADHLGAVDRQQIAYGIAGLPVSYIVGPWYNNDQLYEYTITYNANGSRNEVVYDNKEHAFKYTAVYSYNSDNSISSVDIYETNVNDNWMHIASFPHTYNSQNQLSRIAMRMPKNGAMTDCLIYSYFYKDGVLQKYESSEVASNSKTVVSLTFDDKIKPQYLNQLPGADIETYYLTDFLLPHEHNILSQRMEFYPSNYLVKDFTFTNFYNYNKSGYPVSQKMIYENGRERNYTFTYKQK
ncbi:hypothetical protein GCM10027293_07970 [Pontibacter aydingkolensis]